MIQHSHPLLWGSRPTVKQCYCQKLCRSSKRRRRQALLQIEFYCGVHRGLLLTDLSEYNHFLFVETESSERCCCVCPDIGLRDYPSPALFNLPYTQELRLNLAWRCQRSQADTHSNVPHYPYRGRWHCPAWTLRPATTPGSVQHSGLFTGHRSVRACGCCRTWGGG